MPNTHAPISCLEFMKKFASFFPDQMPVHNPEKPDGIGDLSRRFTTISSPETTDSTAVIFASNPKAFKQGLASAAKVLVTNKKFRPEIEAGLSSKDPRFMDRTFLFSPNAELLMARAIGALIRETPYRNPAQVSIHSTAVISPDAQISAGVQIGPHAIIGAGVHIATGVSIGANSVIEDQTKIDENTVIHPLVYIGHSTQIGKNCEIHPHSTIGKEGFGYAHDEKGNHYRIPHIGVVVIEDDVHVGASCTIDRGTFRETRLQYGAKLDNRVHIGHNSWVGRNSIITAGLLMAGSAKVGANFLSGGGSVVSGHLEVCDNVQIGALSAVGKAITKPGSYGGNPLLPLQAHLKMRSSLAHVYQMRKQISLILKHLGLKGSEPTESED